MTNEPVIDGIKLLLTPFPFDLNSANRLLANMKIIEMSNLFFFGQQAIFGLKI